ncbi:MAG: hypothetical protein INH37_23180 [Myxococcaceae bacterium]|nr:hypothetical protein [Myxococcaceae bacterium]
MRSGVLRLEPGATRTVPLDLAGNRSAPSSPVAVTPPEPKRHRRSASTDG